MGPGYIFQKLGTTNDSNGNPRRLWVLYNKSDGNVHKVIEEGYGGRPAECDCRRPGMVEVASVEITPREYNSWKKAAKDRHIYKAR